MDDKLHWWCDRAWLYVVYLEGVVMLCALPIGLASWDTPKIIGCLLVIFLAAHVFEENTWPAGFFYQNNLGVGSKDPMVYPQNMLTNMITNLGLLTLISVFMLTGIVPDAMLVTLAGMFGVGECIGHTRGGILMYRRFRDAGKRTLYAPGLANTYLCLLPLSTYSWWWLATNAIPAGQILSGVVLFVCLAVCFIGVPLGISARVKSPRFAFTRKGYFEKFD